MSLFTIIILPSDERPTDIVDAAYIARRTGLTVRSVLDGCDGVRAIPRARRKPAGWFRADVDAWLERRADALRARQKKNLSGHTRPRLVRRNNAA